MKHTKIAVTGNTALIFAQELALLQPAAPKPDVTDEYLKQQLISKIFDAGFNLIHVPSGDFSSIKVKKLIDESTKDDRGVLICTEDVLTLEIVDKIWKGVRKNKFKIPEETKPELAPTQQIFEMPIIKKNPPPGTQIYLFEDKPGIYAINVKNAIRKFKLLYGREPQINTI